MFKFYIKKQSVDTGSMLILRHVPLSETSAVLPEKQTSDKMII